MDKVIITVAPTGAWPTKEHNPNIPLTSAEIAADVYECWQGGAAATVEGLVFLKGLIPIDATWSALGIGAGHLPIMYTAIALGGHVRVGMEDNVYYAKNRLAASNAELVARATRIVKEANKTVASSQEAREILRLK